MHKLALPPLPIEVTKGLFECAVPVPMNAVNLESNFRHRGLKAYAYVLSYYQDNELMYKEAIDCSAIPQLLPNFEIGSRIGWEWQPRIFFQALDARASEDHNRLDKTKIGKSTVRRIRTTDLHLLSTEFPPWPRIEP
jgi:hypothetical protein